MEEVEDREIKISETRIEQWESHHRRPEILTLSSLLSNTIFWPLYVLSYPLLSIHSFRNVLSRDDIGGVRLERE